MTKIQIRRDTSSNWQQYNPTPSSGEPCYETDTGKFKIGNGEQPYNSLEYIGAGDLPDNITTQGNTFNGANQLVQLGSDGKLPAIDGSQLTNLPSVAPSNMVTTNTEQFITGRKIINDLRVSGAGGIKDDRGVPFIQTSQINNIWNWVLGSNDSTYFKDIYVRRNTSGEYINIDSGNISDYLTTGGLKYWTGTESDYIAIETKDVNTLYRTTDTNKVYLGSIALGGSSTALNTGSLAGVVYGPVETTNTVTTTVSVKEVTE